MNTNQTLKVVDNVLTLAQMAASMSAQLASINGFLATVHQEQRQPTDEEMQEYYDAYEEARTRVLGNADRIESTGVASATQMAKA